MLSRFYEKSDLVSVLQVTLPKHRIKMLKIQKIGGKENAHSSRGFRTS
jgi:hypothetical protein